MSAVCLTSYAASVLAMVGSAMLVNQIPTASELITCTSNFVTPLIPISASQQSDDAHTIGSDILSEQIITSIQDCPLANGTSNSFCTNKSKFWQDFKLTWIEDDKTNNTSEFEHFTTYTVTDLKMVDGKWKEKENWLSTISNLIHAASNTNSPMIMFPVKIATH